MTIIDTKPSDFTPFPTDEQVIRTLERKREMIVDAWKSLKETEEEVTDTATDWIFEHYLTVIDHTSRLFRKEFDELMKETIAERIRNS